MFGQAVSAGGPVAAYGLGGGDDVSLQGIAPASPSGSPSMGGLAFFPGVGTAAFRRSSELGLLLAIGLVLYVDGRILPRRKRSS